LKSRKFGDRLGEQVEGSEVFGTSPEEGVVLGGPRGTWPDTGTFHFPALGHLADPVELISTHIPMGQKFVYSRCRNSRVQLEGSVFFIPREKPVTENVTLVTKFPYMGGSLSGGRVLTAQHADLLLRPHFSRYHETLMIDGRSGRVVGTSQISKSVDKCIARKLWVAH